jgi:uncharacterized Zn finger protein (UPF0148 family)
VNLVIGKGFYLSKLRVVGLNVEPAEVKFSMGLNVISGPSNTGKSYIFSFVNFMLGATEPPESIPECKGYNEGILEIKTFSGETFVLKRTIKEMADFFISKGTIDCIAECIWKKLKPKHKAGDEDNISAYLLKIAGFCDAKVIKNQRNETRTVSFRDLVKFTMVDEVRIITKESPILSGQVISKTVEKSVFQFVVTGKDAGDVIESIDPRIRVASISGKIEMIDNWISNLISEMSEKENSLAGSDQVEFINCQIEKLSEELCKNSLDLKNEMVKKKMLWELEQEQLSKKIFHEELLTRFDLLKKHYHSDLERLGFIIEGEHLLSQLNSIHCPVCGIDLQQHTLVCAPSEKNHESVLESCYKESEKIHRHMLDLADTSSAMIEEIEEINARIEEFREQILECDIIINDSLKPNSLIAKNDLQKFIDERQELSGYQSRKQRVDELLKEKYLLEAQLHKKNNLEEDRVGIEYDTYEYLCDEITDVLKKWKYPKLKIVNFSGKNFDIEVSGQSRSSHGKGYRAILFSAFVIGILRYTRTHKLPHPGFIILDSPLTTYRENDKTVEDISDDIQEAFFNDLAKNSNDVQIIILENKEPDRVIKDTINYIHFTGVINAGRNGLFPPQ